MFVFFCHVVPTTSQLSHVAQEGFRPPSKGEGKVEVNSLLKLLPTLCLSSLTLYPFSSSSVCSCQLSTTWGKIIERSEIGEEKYWDTLIMCTVLLVDRQVCKGLLDNGAILPIRHEIAQQVNHQEGPIRLGRFSRMRNYSISKTATAELSRARLACSSINTCAASRDPISAASAVANCGWPWNYCWLINWQRRLESWSSSLSLQKGWSARMATRWSSHHPACSIRISLCMSIRPRTFLSKSLQAPTPVDLTIHTFRTVDRTAGRRFAVVARFGKKWEFGDNCEVCKAFVCQNAPPRSCCSWGPAEAKRCMPAPRRLHMASVMVMWSTQSSHSADATFRRPNGLFFICTLR